MSRIDRIAGEMKKEISEIIKFSIKDPRIPDMLTVTSVDVTGDLRYAKVYISILASNEEKKNAMIALRGAAGFLRRGVGQRIQLRYTPEIIFEEDDSIERGMYINELINKTLYPEKEQGD
jgi:ribosome-binding factor A